MVNELESRFEDISEDIEVAVIGCYVNGPGESKGGWFNRSQPKNLMYIDEPNNKISNDNLVDELENKVRENS